MIKASQIVDSCFKPPMSKVKQKVEDQPIEETVVGFKPPMSKVKRCI